MFEDREQAGLLLAEDIRSQNTPDDCIVVGITRGGAVVGYALAQKLGLAFDILVIKKIGAPENPEFAIGAVGPEGIVYYDEEMLAFAEEDTVFLGDAVQAKLTEQQLTQQRFRRVYAGIPLAQRQVLLVDDGIATGATIQCALQYLRFVNAVPYGLAVPVIARDALRRLITQFQAVFPLLIERNLHAVGNYYRNFSEVTDADVIALLKRAQKNQ